MRFTTSDHRSHEYDNGQYDGQEVSEELHAPSVGECAEFWLFINGELRYSLTAVITTVSYH